MHNRVPATVLVALLGAAPAFAKKDTKAALVFYDDTQTGISFQYPRGWRNITISDDASKAEAATEDRQTKITIEAMLKPPTGGVVGVLEQKLPKGSVGGGAGEWKCIEGDIEAGGRHVAWCGRRVGDKELLLVGLFAPNAKAFDKFGGKALVLSVGKSAKGFRAAADE